MPKTYIIIVTFSIFFAFESYKISKIKANNAIVETNVNKQAVEDSKPNDFKRNLNKKYNFPKFYRGIYLNISTARNFKKLSKFVEKAKKSNINTFVLDTQSSRYKKCIVPADYVKYCKDNGIHPIARIVVFPGGLKRYPVSNRIIQEKLEIAESACINGFKEIQFDYIRFNDSNRLKYLSLKKRYRFIEGFLKKAKIYLKKYNVKIAADVFGRIPLNRGDLIGQRMEGLDKVVDIICPMAYPSHYTWSRKLQYNPYHTVYITSKRAKERTKNAEIVTYIQAFKMKLGRMSFRKYIQEQIRAVHDSGIKGFLFWNARQEYDIPFKVTESFYARRSKTTQNLAIPD